MLVSAKKCFVILLSLLLLLSSVIWTYRRGANKETRELQYQNATTRTTLQILIWILSWLTFDLILHNS